MKNKTFDLVLILPFVAIFVWFVLEARTRVEFDGWFWQVLIGGMVGGIIMTVFASRMATFIIQLFDDLRVLFYNLKR